MVYYISADQTNLLQVHKTPHDLYAEKNEDQPVENMLRDNLRFYYSVNLLADRVLFQPCDENEEKLSILPISLGKTERGTWVAAIAERAEGAYMLFQTGNLKTKE